MTHPGVPVSPGIPPLEGAARDALRMAQDRLGALTGPPAFPVLPKKEREEALKDAATAACDFCASFHPGASTAACPRLATFKLNGDGKVTEGSFWPSGVTDSAIQTDGDGAVVSVVHKVASQWDVSQVVRVADVAEEDGEGEGE